MRAIFAVVVITLLTSCTTAGQYRRAAQELHLQDQHLRCWVQPGVSKPFGYKDCAPIELAGAEESSCIAAAASKAQRRPNILLAKQQIESCMRGKGWTLIPVATVIESRRSPTCKDSYPLESCPGELD